MPVFAAYRVSLLDWTGTPIYTLFPGDDFLSITWQHVRNAPGTYRLELVAETTTRDRFYPHYQVLIERNHDPTNPLTWQEEFVGFHLGSDEWWVNPDDGADEHYWASVGYSPEWLLTQPQLQPVRNVGNDNWAYYDLWWASDTADNVIKLMVSENLASPADDDRAYANVTVEGNEGAGNWGCYEGRWVPLMDAILDSIGEDGARGGCDFQVVRVAGGYQFQTCAPFCGTDRRRGNTDGNKPTVFSFDQGNMRNPRYRNLWAEAVTAAYGGWQGGGMEQTIYLEENAAALAASPYARREGYYPVDDINTPDEIPSYLQQKLIEDGEQEYVEATIMQTDACLYGRDFQHGDLCTLELPGGRTFDVQVTEVNASINGQDEERIEGIIEVWTRG